MALPASDDFTGSYGALNTGNWTTVGTANGMIRRGDGTASAEEANSCSRWNADTFDAGQYAETVNTGTWTWTSGGIGPSVRCSSSASTYYGYRANAAGGVIVRVVAGSATTINTDAVAWATSDTVRLEVSGTGATVSLVVKQNGSQVATYDDTNAARITDAGQAGVCGHLSSGSLLITSWTAGNLGGAATAVPVFMAQYRQRSA